MSDYNNFFGIISSQSMRHRKMVSFLTSPI